jgi:hypothetical protein
MGMPIVLSILWHKALALAIVLGVVWWAADTSVRDPNSQMGLYTRHPNRLLFALGLVLLPSIISTVIWGIFGARLYDQSHLLVISFAVSMVQLILSSVFYALAASCVVAPRSEGEPPQWKLGMIVGAAMIFAPPWYGMGMAMFYGIHLVALVVILAVGYALSGRSTRAGVGFTSEVGDAAVPESPARALLIGFAPAALMLVFFTVAATDMARSIPDNVARALLIICCVATLVCCFIASRMLFARRTSGAVAGGVLLLLLNLFIAFAFGCGAILIGMSFH